MTVKYTFDLNPYVEAKARYLCDKVIVGLDEGTKTVTATRADTFGTAISGGLLLTKTLSTLDAATAYYENIIGQLQQGDVIRNL